MLEAYNKHVDERAEKNIPPKPLTAEQIANGDKLKDGDIFHS